MDVTKRAEFIFNKAKEVIAGPGHKPIKPQPAPKKTEFTFNKAKEVIAGPGHKPIKPHPPPNKTDPMISFLSTSLLDEIKKFDENNGFFLFLNK